MSSKPSDRIYLLGMPASGKSTLGKCLANRLGYSFFDLDQLLEAQAGRTIPEIFRQKGEHFFRLLEEKILRNTLPTKAIIATGGGTPCFFRNMDFIQKQGIAVFLDTPPDLLLARVRQNSSTRPLFANNPEATLAQMHNRRMPYYRRADFTLKCADKPPAVLVDKLLKHFEKSSVPNLSPQSSSMP